MKLVFKMTAAQNLIAIAIRAANAAELVDSPYEISRQGDFIVEDFGYGVRNQSLTVTENGYLIYEGGRTTLHAGVLDGYKKILTVFGSREAATKALVSVESSAPHLEWWETEAEGVQRASVERLIGVAAKGTAAGAAACDQLKKLVERTVGRSDAQLSAMLTYDELKTHKKVMRALEGKFSL